MPLQNGALVDGLGSRTNTWSAEEQTPWGGQRGADERYGVRGRWAA